MSTFRFQQFSVLQEKSAMKVCTDATLFGAMAPVRGGEQVLDFGAGTGLLALMAAQLGAHYVTAVELTEEAYREAATNFLNSPWAERLSVIHEDIRHYAETAGRQFDLIISNPPFFENHSKTETELRTLARHTDSLPFAELLRCVDKLLAPQGLFYLLIPSHAATQIIAQAEDLALHPAVRTDIRGYAHTQAKVTALTFSRTASDCQNSLVTIYREHRVYSEESTRYLAPFLLRFA